MQYPTALLRLTLMVLITATSVGAAETLETNREWNKLPEPGADEGRETLAAAASWFEGLDVELAGEALTKQLLKDLAATPEEEPLTRALRESLGHAVDRKDFLFFLDDVVRARPEQVRVNSGRARAAGIFLHPNDVFRDQPQRYGERALNISPPPSIPDLEPAPDDAPLGERWSARYPNPADEKERLEALDAKGGEDFRRRIEHLIEQLRDQGAEVHVLSTVRRPERGYLMYGAFSLSRADTREEVEQQIEDLDRLNEEWGLNIPIQWAHPQGWEATIEAAREMADAYNVVYATRRGARYSRHYGPGAIDMSITRLPRSLHLEAPDGTERTFDLSDADEPRDLNLSPRLIDWTEEHFDFYKLRADYPHWEDATRRFGD